MLTLNPLALLVAGAFFMEFLDGTIIVTALPRMAEALGSTAVALHVGITAYLLTVAVFILPGGWASERFGARRVFTTAVAVFTLGSVLCGLANSVETFVAARVLQGIGGAMMVPVGRLVVLRTTPKPELMSAIATLTWPGLTAPLLGPPLGGFITEHASWRWIFFINLPLGLLGMMLALRLVPKLAPVAPRRFDLVGFLLAGAVCLCGTLAFDMLGRRHQDWAIILPLAAATLAGAVLLPRHLARHAAPLLSLAPFAVATFRMVMGTGTAMRILIGTVPFLLPLLFQLGFGLDPFHAGLLVLALFVGNLGMKPLTTPLLRRFGFRTILVGNGLVQAVAMLGCAMLSPAAPVPVIAALLILTGASRSLQFTALATLAFADVPEPSMAPANTWFSVAFQLALGVGVALGAVALQVAGLAGGHAAADPGLPEFRWAFLVIAVLMTATSLAGLRLARDAGAVVTTKAAR